MLTRQAVTTSKTGVVNNTIQVKRTDFEVFDALRIDSEDTADFSGSVGFKTANLHDEVPQEDKIIVWLLEDVFKL